MFKNLTLLAVLSVAVWMDVQRGKVSNRLIVMGAGFGFIFQVLEHGVMGIYIFLFNMSLPVILLYLLFLMRALGAGDIKLFSVMGGFLCRRDLFYCMIAAFLIGAGISLVRLLRTRQLVSKMQDLMQYVEIMLLTKEIKRYRSVRTRQDVICFTIPILAGYLCYLLGVFI